MSLENAVLALAESINNLAGQYQSLHQSTQTLTQAIGPANRPPIEEVSIGGDEVKEPEEKPKAKRGRPRLEAVAPAATPTSPPKVKPKVEDPLDPFAADTPEPAAPVVKAPAPKPAQKAKAASAAVSQTPAAPTKDEVMDALRHAVRVKGEDPVLELMQEFGVERVSQLSPADYAGIFARLKGMTND